MTRLALLVIIAVIIILGFLAVNGMKESYKILPIQEAKKVDTVPFSDWHSFKAPSGKFSVMLPVLPQHATQTLTDPKTKQVRFYDMYVSQKEDDTIFMISLIKFQEGEMTPPDVIQKAIVNDMLASNPQNQLKNMQVSDFHNFKTLDFTIENPDMTLLGKTFMDANTLYLLSTIFKPHNFNPRDYDYFVNSFVLQKGASKPNQVPEKK